MSELHPLTLPEKGEIEELVRLSYQALERNLEERSRTVINERGWGETISAMNRGMPERMRPMEPWEPVPPPPEVWNQNNVLFDRHFMSQPYTEYEEIYPDRNTPAQVPLPSSHTREHPSAMRRERQIIVPPPTEGGRREQDTMNTAPPEVRFTLPRVQLASGTADIAKEAQEIPAKPSSRTTMTDEEVLLVRARLARAQKRKEEAEKAKDITTVFDLTTYGIPDMKAKLEKLLEQQRQEREKSHAPVAQDEKNKGSHHTEVDTESEYEDDE